MLQLKDIDYHQLSAVEYDEMFYSSENATPFHSRSWLNIVNDSRSDLRLKVLIVSESSQALAYLPYFTILGRPDFWLFMPYGGYSGFIYNLKNREKIIFFLRRKKFTKLFTQIIIYDDLMYKGLSYLREASERYSTWILPIKNNYNEMFSELPSKTKNQIRKAFKDGVIYKKIQTIEELDQCRSLYLRLTQKHKIANPYIFELFNSIYNESNKNSNVIFNVAIKSSQVIAYSVFLSSRMQIFYWLNASDPDFSAHNATNGLLAEMIRYCCEQPDVKTLNFGAVPSGNDGLLFFKKNWGTLEKKYGYYNSHLKSVKDTIYGFMGR